MSVKAMNWAMEQTTGDPRAQCLLYVVADCANPDGICWPSADWMADKSQQSRATVYRRLAELREMGLLALFPRWIDEDGKIFFEAGHGRRQTSPEIRLIFSAKAAMPRRRRRGADDEDDGPEAENSETGLSPVATGPCRTVERQGPSHCGDNNQESEPKDSPPNPPSGGVRHIDQELEPDVERFRAKYPAPITNLPRLRTVLAAMTAPERAQVLTAVDGYASFIHGLERKGKARAVKDADRWVSGGLWQGFVTSGEQAQANAQRQTVAADSPEGRAWLALHRIAGLSEPFGGNGQFYLPGPLSAQALALADSPPASAWIFIGVESANQVGAWDELVSRELRGRARPPIVNDRNREHRRGFKAPWPWPPLKDGTVKTGPPQDSINEQDDHPLKIGNEGKQC